MGRDISIFRHMKVSEAVDGTVSDAELRAALIEHCLSKGYVPMNVEYETIDHWLGQRIRRAQCQAAYAGKRRARTIGYQEVKSTIFK